MILFFGPPGSGKSVQGKLLVERNNWRWVSTGVLLRQSRDPEIIQTLAAGSLVENSIINEVLEDSLGKIDIHHKILLDGYPRNEQQANWLDARAERTDRKIDCLILFQVPHQELMRRLTNRGRPEDDSSIAAKRLEIYRATTQPVVAHYQERGLPILEIDGIGDVYEVHERIQGAVAKCLQLA